ncbi:MAG: ABC transporter substrate-binding protein [Alphaproteobacteria bacterium]
MSTAAPALSDPPQRVATMGLCTDQIVMLLADPDQIVSVHWVTQDPADSAMAERASAYHANHGLAEEVIVLEPDLVFMGSFNSPFAKAMLERQGIAVVEVPAAVSFEQVRRNIRQVASVLGLSARGEAIIADFDRDLAVTEGMLSGGNYRALVYGANGYSAGAASLFNDVMRHLGLANVATDFGLQGWVKMSVEDVVEADPDLLVLGEYRLDAPSQANTVLQHPALTRVRQGAPVVRIPTTLWNCGTPLLAEAARRLADSLSPRAADLRSGD